MELRSIKRKRMNKKGQFESALLAIIMIFIVGIILFFFNHVNDKLYTSLDKYFTEDVKYNNTEVTETIQKIHTVDNIVWDYAFLAIFAGQIIAMLLLSFATRVNVAFFWLFVLLGIIILIVGVMLSNIWQGMADNSEFSETVLRFPITNSLLGTYFPTAVLAILFIFMIVLFGKPPPGGEG